MTLPHLAACTEADSLLFLSGQLAFDKSGTFVDGDIAVQTDQVLANIAAVLSAAGSVPADILKTTIWLRDRTDFTAFNDRYAQYFGDHRPARTTVISDLVLPAARVEIEVIAKRS